MINMRAETVGSLLRPPLLLKAHYDFDKGLISQTVFKQIEDQAVNEVIQLQEEVGLQIVTDGEMRRQSFQSQMTEAVRGFGKFTLDAFLWGKWQGDKELGEWIKERPSNLGVVDKLYRTRHLSVDEYIFLKNHTTKTSKITLPSPSLFANFWSSKFSKHVYPNLDLFLADVVNILRDEVSELVSRGATYIQLDAPHYCLLLNPETYCFYKAQGWNIDTWLRRGIELDNEVIGNHPITTFGFHL